MGQSHIMPFPAPEVCACGQPATSGSSRSECPRCFRTRLASLTLPISATPTRSSSTYYDSEALAELVGPDSEERMMDDTSGLGFAKLDAEGRPWHRDRKSGDVVPVAEKDLDRVYLAGDTEH